MEEDGYQTKLSKTVTRDKGHHIIIKGSIHQGDASNIGAPIYIKQI